MEKNSSSLSLIKELLTGLNEKFIINIVEEKQNQAYDGVRFQINDLFFRSRLAKKTPTKSGYFVAFWEKNEANQNQPYAFHNAPDKLIINVMDDELKGQFIFPKSILLQQDILSTSTTKGKMGIRVYPSWSKNLNNYAMKTQIWQLPYFIDLTAEINNEKLHQLYFE